MLLGSLSAEYDNMVKIIESKGSVSLLEAKEMLRREYESLQRREKQESAFRAGTSGTKGQQRQRRRDDRRASGGRGNQDRQNNRHGGRNS